MQLSGKSDHSLTHTIHNAAHLSFFFFFANERKVEKSFTFCFALFFFFCFVSLLAILITFSRHLHAALLSWIFIFVLLCCFFFYLFFGCRLLYNISIVQILHGSPLNNYAQIIFSQLFLFFYFLSLLCLYSGNLLIP